MKNEVEDEVMKNYVVSKEDFKVYFQNRKVININEFTEYLYQKNNNKKGSKNNT